MANANLFQQYLQPVRSVTDYAADLDKQEGAQLALQGQRRQNELAALTADQTRRTMADSAEDRNALQRLASTWGADTSIDQRVAALRNSGRPALMQQADALEKQGLDKQKVGAEAAEKNSKVMDETLKRYRAALDYISTPQDAVRWLKAQYDDPVTGKFVSSFGDFDQTVTRIPTDPKQFQQWRQQAALGMDKYMENQRLLAQQAETVRHNKAGEATAAGQLTVAQGNLSLRGKELSQADRHFNEKQSAEKSGGNASEGERNAAGYLMRMEEATKLLDQFEGKGAASYGSQAAGAVPFVGGAIRRAVMTPEQQQYRQAQEDWVRSKLRKESGASIASDEMEREIETYFPMPGDGKEVIAQKRRARATANEAMRQSAGRAIKQTASTNSGASSGVVDFGSLK